MTKGLRVKNKCNRKLVREQRRHGKKIRKLKIDCPEISLTIIKRDTVNVEVPEIEIKTVYDLNFDSLVIDSLATELKNAKNKSQRIEYINRYIPRFFNLDTTFVIDGAEIRANLKSGKLHHYLLKPKEVVTKIVEIPFETIKKIQLTPLEKAQNLFSKFDWWVIIFLVMYVLYFLLKKYIKKATF